MYSYGPPHMAEQKQDDQLEHTYSSSVRILDVALKTCLRRRTIGKSGERGSGISVLATRHDDEDLSSKLKSKLKNLSWQWYQLQLVHLEQSLKAWRKTGGISNQEESSPSRSQHCWDRLESWEEFWRDEETLAVKLF